MPCFFRRNRIVARTAPRMTAANPLNPEPYAFEKTVRFNCLNHILRAGRLIAAHARTQRRNKNLIKSNQRNRQFFHRSTLRFLLVADSVR